ncbi:ECF transporter S component [Candidatus Villigracilis saccharophilus]|uniref:ECF transporter S component n=1 Tax=Candidatus Villigracilis saccharophilus TaxID=3140684 RepID=UPI0031375AA2|nr:ECF transporter S component [Anaerolineales bacterium]
MAFFLVRKPGSMLIIGLIETTMEALLGNPSGISTIGWGITQGLRKGQAFVVREFWLGAFLAGPLHIGTLTAFLFGGSTPEIVSAYWTATPINLISGFIFSGARLVAW